MSKLEKIHVSLLNDYYGGLLTEYQSKLISLYYDEDLSLSEIAEICETTRQAVSNVLRRATQRLEHYEKKLQIVEKIKTIEGTMDVLIKSDNQPLKLDIINLREQIRNL